MNRLNPLARLVAEFIGTFALVFAGTGAIVVDAASGGAIGHVGISLVFGLAVAAMVYAVGDVSGAHFNPAVTAGFWLSGRFPAARVPAYVASQCAAAILASVLLRFLFPDDATLGGTAPVGSLAQAFGLEVVLSFFLMFVILGVTAGEESKQAAAGAAIGATVALGSLFGGPISGASMNPARSLGPALVTGDVEFLWLYVVSPLVGAGLATLATRLVRGPRARSDSSAAGLGSGS